MGINCTDYAADGTLERVGETAVFRAVDSEDDFVFAVFFVNPFDLQHGAFTNRHFLARMKYPCFQTQFHNYKN